MMKKLLLFVTLFVFDIFSISAYDYNNYNSNKDSNNRLRYDIENVIVNNEGITISGWGFVDGIHTLGGKNYQIDIIAIPKADLHTYAVNPDSVEKQVIGKRLKTRRESGGSTQNDYYVGGNDLYPSTCYKIYRGNELECQEVHLGHYKNSYTTKDHTSSVDAQDYVSYGKNEVRSSSDIGLDDLKYASCSGESEVADSCIHFDPYFKIKILNSELKQKFDSNDEIIFVITMSYVKFNDFLDETSSGNNGKIYLNIDNPARCSWMDRNDDRYFNNCDYYNVDSEGIATLKTIGSLVPDEKSISRVLAFDSRVKKTENSNFLNKLNVTFNTNFTVTENFGLLRKKINNDILEYVAPYNYFEYQNELRNTNNVFKVTSIERYNAPTGGTGISTEITYYKLCVWTTKERTVNDIERTYHQPSSSCEKSYYAASTWGSVSGIVTLTITKPPEPKLGVCVVNKNTNSCEKSEFSTTCPEIVRKRIPTTVLNDGCSSGVSEDGIPEDGITLLQIYNIEEYSTLESYFDTSSKYKRGMSLGNELKFKFNRNIKIATKESQIYYYIKRCYLDSDGAPHTEDGYIDKTTLINKLNEIGGTDSANIKVQIENASNEIANNFSLYDDNTAYDLDYDYPNSNDFDLTKNYKNSSNIMKLESNTVSKSYVNNTNNIEEINIEKIYKIKNACINLSNSSENQGNVKYVDSSGYSGYNCVGNKYFIPFNIPNNINNISLNTSIKYNSIVKNSNVELKNDCNFGLDNGNLEKYKYRVINLDNPFPNIKPKLDGRASNWYNLWTSNNNILRDRYNENGVEYILNLTPNNIADIRNYNKKKYNIDNDVNPNFLYINADIDNAGDSSFINNYLKDNIGLNANHSDLGERGVE